MNIFNRPIKILLLTNWLIVVSGAMLAPIYAIFIKKVGGDLLDVSYAAAIFFLVGGCVTLISGKYSDRIKENELVLVFGGCVMAIGYFGYLLVNSLWALFVVQIITGLGDAIYYPVFDVLYARHSNKKSPGLEWGAWESLYYFTAAFGALAGGFLAQWSGFDALFIIMGILCLASSLYILMLPRSVL